MKTCGTCKFCRPVYSCGCDCDCVAKEIEVSQDDDIRFYGDNDKPCEKYSA